MGHESEREELASGFMHCLATEDVDAANITGEENMAGELEVQASIPEDEFPEARDCADKFGFKPAGKRGKDERTGETVFSFEPRI